VSIGELGNRSGEAAEPGGTSHDGPAELPQETAPPPGTREQGSAGQHYPRRRRRTRVLAVAGAVAAAALAAGITAALHVAPAAPSPLSAVTSALARTSAQSYTFSLDSTVRFPTKELTSDLVSGAYDPRQHLGTEQLTARSAGQAQRAQVRFIGAYLYTSVTPGAGFGKPWDKSPLAAATAAGMPPGDLYGFASDQAVSPSELTVVLRSAGTAVHDAGSVSGPGWTGIKYTFTTSLYGGREHISGTVYVDQQGWVRRLMTITRQGNNAAGKTLLTTSRDFTFGDFGAPVRVTTPSASQVKSTSGKPYWGFFF
jgi:hypothetical protein